MNRLADRFSHCIPWKIVCVLLLLTSGGVSGLAQETDENFPRPTTRSEVPREERLTLAAKAEGADLQVRLYRQGDRIPEDSRKAQVKVTFRDKVMVVPFPDTQVEEFKYQVVIGSEQSSPELRQLLGPAVLICTPESALNPLDANRHRLLPDSNRQAENLPERFCVFPIDAFFKYYVDSDMQDRTLENILDATGQPIPDASYLLQVKIGTDTLILGPISLESPFRSMHPLLLCTENARSKTLFMQPEYGIGEGGFSLLGSNSDFLLRRVGLVRKGSEAYRHAVHGVLRDPSGKPLAYIPLREDTRTSPWDRFRERSAAFSVIVWTDSQGRFIFYPPRGADPREGEPLYLPDQVPFSFWLENLSSPDWFPVVTAITSVECNLVVETAPLRKIRVLDDQEKPRTGDMVIRLTLDSGAQIDVGSSNLVNTEKLFPFKGKLVSCYSSSLSRSEYQITPAEYVLNDQTPMELFFHFKRISPPPSSSTSTPVPSQSQPQPVQPVPAQPTVPGAAAPTPTPQAPTDLAMQVLDYFTDEPVSNTLVVFVEIQRGQSSDFSRLWQGTKAKWIEAGAPILQDQTQAVIKNLFPRDRAKILDVTRSDEQGLFHLKTTIPLTPGSLRNHCLMVLSRKYLMLVFNAGTVLVPAVENSRNNKLYLIREVEGRTRIQGDCTRFPSLTGRLEIGPIPLNRPPNLSRSISLPVNSTAPSSNAPDKINVLREGLKNSGILSLAFQPTTSGTQEFSFPCPAGSYSRLSLSILDVYSSLNPPTEKQDWTPVPSKGVCDFGTWRITPRIIQKVYVQVQGPSGKPIPDIALRLGWDSAGGGRSPSVAKQDVFTDKSGMAVYEVLEPGVFRMFVKIYRPIMQVYGGEPIIREFSFDWSPERSEKKEPYVLKLTEAELQKLEGLIPIEQYR